MARSTLDDGCWTVEAGGEETLNTCEPPTTCHAGRGVRGPRAIEDLQRRVQAAFADYENPGFIVHEVDGEWYFSPIATCTEQLLAVLRALSREEIEELQVKVEDAFDVLFGSGDVVRCRGAGSRTTRCPATMRRRTPRDGISDPANECFVESEAATGPPCFQALVEGPIEAATMFRCTCGSPSAGWPSCAGAATTTPCPTTTSSPLSTRRHRASRTLVDVPASSRTANCRSSWRHRSASTVATSTTSTTTSTSGVQRVRQRLRLLTAELQPRTPRRGVSRRRSH